jgi:hypothetical protein
MIRRDPLTMALEFFEIPKQNLEMLGNFEEFKGHFSGIHNGIFSPLVCGRVRMHAPNTVLRIQSTQYLRHGCSNSYRYIDMMPAQTPKRRARSLRNESQVATTSAMNHSLREDRRLNRKWRRSKIEIARGDD